MKLIPFYLVFLFVPFLASAQELPTFSRNNIYLEAGGAGLFGSVNYERQLTKAPGIGARIGIGFYTENAFFLTIPAGINYLFTTKRKDSFIEASLNVVWAREHALIFEKFSPAADHFTSFVPSIAYRRHLRKNVVWRANICAIANNSGLYPWVGFAVGKRF